MDVVSNNRRKFLKNTLVGGVALTVGAHAGAATDHKAGNSTRPSAYQDHVMDLVVPKMDKVRFGFIGLGRRGGGTLKNIMNVEGAYISALCDVDQTALEKSAKDAALSGFKPARYAGNDEAYRDLIAREDVDAVFISTPWRWHTPMALAAMEAGKHVFVEVPAALTVDECWQLVEASEKYRVNCIMLENVCYGRDEMMVLNMVRSGLFGELLHGEAAYIHELRWQMKDIEKGTGSWRTPWHAKRNGNLYPTHGLGPVAQYMGINRGDRFDYMTSMSTAALGRRLYADRELEEENLHKSLKFINGDMNTSLIRTVQGRTIMLQYDTTSPRPYTRHNMIQGTNGAFAGFPNRIALENNPLSPGDSDGFHHWDEDMGKWFARYEHPVWKYLMNSNKVENDSAEFHGNLDFVMAWRIVYCLRNGLPLDQNVYDAAAWSVPNVLSAASVASKGQSVDFPDFTRGAWEKAAPLNIGL